jgi:hypothetical protein
LVGPAPTTRTSGSRRQGREARPLPIGSTDQVLLPSWTTDGALLVTDVQRGAVWQVALATGALTPVAQLAPATGYEGTMALPDGDLLSITRDVERNVAAAYVD